MSFDSPTRDVVNAVVPLSTPSINFSTSSRIISNVPIPDLYALMGCFWRNPSQRYSSKLSQGLSSFQLGAMLLKIVCEYFWHVSFSQTLFIGDCCTFLLA